VVQKRSSSNRGEEAELQRGRSSEKNNSKVRRRRRTAEGVARKRGAAAWARNKQQQEFRVQNSNKCRTSAGRFLQ